MPRKGSGGHQLQACAHAAALTLATTEEDMWILLASETDQPRGCSDAKRGAKCPDKKCAVERKAVIVTPVFPVSS